MCKHDINIVLHAVGIFWHHEGMNSSAMGVYLKIKIIHYIELKKFIEIVCEMSLFWQPYPVQIKNT